MRRTVVVGLLLLVGSGIGRADDLSCGRFALAQEKVLHLRYGALPLVVGDRLDYSSGFEQAEEMIATRQDGKQILNVVRSQGDPASFRKEVAIGPEGVELTVRFRLPAYSNDPKKGAIGYAFSVPLKSLEGAHWKAFVGTRSRQTKVVEGEAGSQISGIRYIAFRSDRVRLVLDFNPQGVCAGSDYTSSGEPVTSWSMRRVDDVLEFSFAQRASFYGGVFMSKCLIYEGEYDYDARHAYRLWGYRGETPPTKLFSFGTKQPAKEATAADMTAYSKERGFGWSEPAGLALVERRPTGLVNNALAARDGKEHEFLVDVPAGRWLVTPRTAAVEGSVGPMEVAVDGRRVAEKVVVEGGEVRSITAAVEHRGPGPLRIRFGGGSWAVSSIAVQAVVYAGEDFSLSRGLWNVEGVFTP